MKPDQRAIIAYTAGCMISGNSFDYILDQFQNRTIPYDGRFNHSYVTVIEKETGSELMGTILGKEISLFNSAEGVNIKLNLTGSRFTGTLTDSKGFNGEVAERIVKLYDYDEGKYFNFCLINEPAAKTGLSL